MKGLLILSMQRSGTNWLGAISNQTKQTGNSEEWLSFDKLEKPAKSFIAESFYQHVIQRGSTENGYFSVKIFPHHLRQCSDTYNFDFIRKCVSQHDTKIIFLHRENQHAQAISLIKARQTGKWRSTTNSRKSRRNVSLEYDFKALCQAYFFIGRSNSFWRSYLSLNALPFEEFTYESLMNDPSPFANSVTRHFDVPPIESFDTKETIQRDDLSAQWHKQFLHDISAHGIHPEAYQPLQPRRGITNAARVVLGLPTTMHRRSLRA